jgi:hypothetical protein
VENRTNQVTYSGADRDRTDCLRNAIAVVSSEASLNLELSQVRDGTLEDPSPGGTRNPAEAPSSIAAAGPKKNGGKPPAKHRARPTPAQERKRKPRKGTTRCTACGRLGHNARNPECPEYGKKNGNGSGGAR